jgi:hypothetical protein
MEFVEVTGYNGLWVLDDDVEKLRRVEILVREDGYVVTLHEEMEAKPGMQMRTSVQIKYDASENLIYLKMYGQNSLTPILILKKKGDGIKIDKLEIR